MQFRLGIHCFCYLLLVGSPCLAATIEPVQGNLYISSGQGFQPVNGRVDANVGDTVMVAPGSTAVAVYPDGCKVAIQPGDVTTISRLSPCTNPFPPDGTVAQDTSSTNAGLAWGITGAVLGAAGIGVGVYALEKNNSNGTTINTGFTCGSAANPCFTSVSP
jgi:hypothetical protein